MRELSESLLLAQRGRSARPCVQMTVDDRHVGVGRLRPVPVYGGSEEAGPSAMAAVDGHVLRARVDASGRVWFCRTAAGAGSGWNTWVLLATGAQVGGQIALAAGDGYAFLLYAGSGGGSLRAQRSTDGGVSWLAEETVLVATSGCRIASLAAVHGTAHGCVCVFVEDGQGSTADDVAHLAWWASGGWTTAAWPRDPGHMVGGVAAVALAGSAALSVLSVVVCGRFEDVTRPSVRLYYVQLTAGGTATWLYRGAVCAGDAEDYSWSWPALVQGEGDRPRLFLLENTEFGSRLGQVSMPRLGSSGPVSASDLVPLAWQSAYGASAVALGTGLYLGCSSWLLRSPLYSGAAGQRLDVSADVVAYEGRWLARGGATGRGAQLEVLLDNSDGRYDGEGSPLRPGGQVSLREGYWAASGAEVVYQAPCWIGEIERSALSNPLPGGQVRLRCYDGWAKLWRGVCDRAREWSCAPGSLLAEALERFGFVYSDDGSVSLYAALTPPRFSLGVGEAWGGLVERVLDYCGCELRFGVVATEEAGWPSARAHVFTPTEEPMYAFGATGHPVRESALVEREAPGMWAQVYGDGIYGEALDGEAIAALGFAAMRQAIDLRLNEDTDVTAAQAAGFLLRRYGRERAGGWVVARPNVGQDLLDVVTVQVGAREEERRVLAIERRYDRLRGVYEQRLVLGAV